MSAAVHAAVIFWATQLHIPVELLHAMVQVESGGEMCAMRYEPDFRWLFTPEKVKPRFSTLLTEQMGQKFSYGPLQIMGATAREMGFRGWLSELCGEKGIEYGAKYLRKQYDRYGTWEAAIAAYNAGSPRKADGQYVNQRYVDKVTERWT